MPDATPLNRSTARPVYLSVLRRPPGQRAEESVVGTLSYSCAARWAAGTHGRQEPTHAATTCSSSWTDWWTAGGAPSTVELKGRGQHRPGPEEPREPPWGVEPQTYALRGCRSGYPGRSTSTESTTHSADGTPQPGRTRSVMPELMPATEACKIDQGEVVSDASRMRRSPVRTRRQPHHRAIAAIDTISCRYTQRSPTSPRGFARQLLEPQELLDATGAVNRARRRRA